MHRAGQSPGLRLDLVHISVGDDGQPFGDQAIVHIPLTLQLVLLLKLLRQATLHLPKPQVVHLRRVHMRRRELTAKRLGQRHRIVNTTVGVIGGVHAQENGVVAGQDVRVWTIRVRAHTFVLASLCRQTTLSATQRSTCEWVSVTTASETEPTDDDHPDH